MSDKAKRERTEFLENTKESKVVSAYDRKCRQEDSDNFIKNFVYLQTFRDENKQVGKYV